jgi:hypothetical protein
VEFAPGSLPSKGTEFPIAQVAAISFRSFDGTLAAQWEEIRKLNSATDVLVVVKRDGKSLDYVEGIVGEISSDQVDFKLDNETNRVDRAKVAGIIYFRPEKLAAADSRVTLRGRSGLQVNAANILLNGNTLSIRTPVGAKFTWPIDDIEAADYSAGKLLYLSDMEPASQKWLPLVSLPPGAKLAAEYGEPHRDRSVFGGSISVSVDESADSTSVPQKVSRQFNKGLAVRSHTELIYRLPPGFNRFKATAGIDPGSSTTGNVQLSIFVDERPVLDAEVAGDQSAQQIDVPVANAKRLRIVVDFGKNLDAGDWLNLCDAKLVK